MDAFPQDFNLSCLQSYREGCAIREAQEQERLLKKAREDIYATYKTHRDNGSPSVILWLPDKLNHSNQIQIARELCKAFPNRVEFHDGVSFKQIFDPTDPPAMLKYRLNLSNV